MRTISKVSLLTLSLMLLAFAPLSSYGQAVYGSVFGTVTDQSGAIVPKATVTITNLGTNTMVASYVAPALVTQFVSVESELELQSDGATLPAWYRGKSNYCQ